MVSRRRQLPEKKSVEVSSKKKKKKGIPCMLNVYKKNQPGVMP